jgi:rhodanese-related sulfurtransferase
MKTINKPARNSITAGELASKLGSKCDGILLDVRTPAEFKGAHVRGARLEPLGDLQPREFLQREAGSEDHVYVICQSGNRASKAIQAFENIGFERCVLLEGGMDAWVQAGLPVEREEGAGLPIMRQVQIISGGAVAVGSLLTLLVDPWFVLIPLTVGCGLLVAGLSGWCGMALLLAKMPWNRGPACQRAACSESTERTA